MFTVDNQSRQPVYEQIITQVERFIMIGLLNEGEQLPSVRNISIQLSVNPNTVQKALTELFRRGIIISIPGRGSFIANNAKELLTQYKMKELSKINELAHELYLAGIDKKSVLNEIEKAYKEEDKK